jgi:hypothetical protein
VGILSTPTGGSAIVNLYGTATPTNGSTYTVAALGQAGTSNPIIGITEGSTAKTYTATSGTVNVTLVGGKVRATLTNAQFKNVSDASDVRTGSFMLTVTQ